MQLKNKKAIVTGGSQGIGRGIAVALAKAGADVVIQYRTAEDKALSAMKEIEKVGRSSFVIQADFNEKNAPENFLELAIEKLNGADILVNCAAAYECGALLEIDSETFAWMQKIKRRGSFKINSKFFSLSY